MRNILRNGALALGLVTGAALMTSPAIANSIHKSGQFGGSWSKIEPSAGFYERRHHAGRVGPLYGGRYYYRGPHYGYYSPRYSYYSPRRSYYGYGDRYYRGRGPGFGFRISVY
jgi:hypothetical protein